VKIPFSEFQRRGIVPLAGLGLAIYYLLVLLPLSRQAKTLDEPVRSAWQKLSVSLDLTNATAIDFLHITNQISETRQACRIFENAKKQATARLQLGAAVRTRMQTEFELVEYANERSKLVDELGNLAKKEQVAVEPGVFASFPEQTADIKQRGLLWAALSLTDGLLRTAIRSKVSVIHGLDLPPVLTNAPPTNSLQRLAEIPLQLEFTGTAGSFDRLLQALPLRADEIRTAGLPEAPVDKPALCLDRLVVQKQSAEKIDEVHVWLRVVGFVLRE